MVGQPIKTRWKICWKFISPVIILGVIVGGITQMIQTGHFTYTAWDRVEVELHPIPTRPRQTLSFMSQNDRSLSISLPPPLPLPLPLPPPLPLLLPLPLPLPLDFSFSFKYVASFISLQPMPPFPKHRIFIVSNMSAAFLEVYSISICYLVSFLLLVAYEFSRL